ncbi:UNVERIFIED_CONTAM: hypothetical protein PYX00_000564 [Menopon gallinae]|uniref:Chitin-binding type-2 domain-containing protein n=1 Tax=Menopon gallinae TaxID=328185 RepID=A0AAW2I9V6_9NEOP
MMTRAITSLIGAVLLACLAYGSKCPEQESTTRHVLCYYEGRTPLNNVNLCNCTHVVLTNAVRVSDNYSLGLVEGAKEHLKQIAERKQSLTKIFTITWRDNLEPSLIESENKSRQLINGISDFLGSSGFNGIELNLPFTARDTASKDSITSFVKTLKKTLENSPHVRVKREGYDVSENVQDDITTAPYRTPTIKSVRSAEQGNKKSGGKRRKNYRTSRRREQEDDKEEVTERKVERTERRSRRMRKELRENHGYEPKFLVLVRLPINPEVIAKKFDLKALSKYADMLVVSTHNITDDSERRLTYHPSRLMGLSDMLNADSILDFLSGLGVTKSKIILTLPANILKFDLLDPKKTTPRSPRVGEPKSIDQSQLCKLFSKGNWTVERDDDLTAPYAFSARTWLAYEDKVSVNIKAKYILLRELAGGAIYPIDADTGRDPCNDTSSEVGFLTNTLFKNIMSLDRKPRGLVLESLQQDIHDTSYSTVEAGVHLSEYRIVRVVDHSGAVHVIRKNTKTQFECSRQGYFSHPLGCNKFYRCVKFNQYTDDFTVFEYDCPAGLAFDERWEVCVWPGSLPHGAPCTGSSEIAPVPRSHYQCPNHEGYYADPENCRWFFACLDHARDGVTPLTAYEFRCPFGLVFNEQNLACDWPWNVGSCGNRGFSGVVVEHYGGSSSSLQSATFVNSASHGSNFGAYQGGAASGFAVHQGGASSGFSSHQGSASGFGAYQGGASSGFSSHRGSASGFGSYQGGAASGFASQGGLGSGFAHSSQYNANQRGSSAFGGSVAGSGYIAGHFEDTGDRASFGNLPEHEISGGRILNKGGVILNENVNFHSSFGSGRGSGSFEGAHVNVATATPIVSTVQTATPVPVVSKLKTVDYTPRLSSPRPFSVHVPEVQVNQEIDVPSYVGASTTPRVETYHGANSGNLDSVNTFTVSSDSGIHTQENAAFGEKVNIGIVHDNQNLVASGKQVGIQLSTPSPIDVQAVHSVSGGYEQVSGISASTAGYDNNGIVLDTVKFSPKVYQGQNFASGAVFTGPSSTPAPSVSFQEDFAGKGAVLVTPRPEIHSVQLQKTDFVVSNGSSFAHSPVVHVSTAAPFTVSGGLDQSFGLKQSGLGNAILLEEKVERVVIPRVRPSVAPNLQSVSFNQETVSAKSVVSDSGANFAAAVTPATISVQEFVGPVQLSSPAPFSLRKEIVQQPVVTTPAPALFKAAEYLPPAKETVLVQENVDLFKPAVQSEVVQTVSTPQPAVFKKTGLVGGHLNGGVTVVKPAVQFASTPAPAVFNVAVDQGRVDSGFSVQQQTKFVQPVVQFASTPAPAVFKAAEYLPPVQSSVVVQENVNLYKPAVQTKLVQPVSGVAVQENVNLYTPAVQTKFVQSTPAPAVFSQSEHVSGNFGGRISSVLKQSPAPAVFKGPEYLPPVVDSVVPAVQTQFVQPVVSKPAPAVFKRPSFVSTRVDTVVKPVVQVSTPAPPVFKESEYLAPVQTDILVSTGVQQNFGEKTKIVQPVVSTPAPAVFGVAVDQGRVDVKSNVQTYAQSPVFQDVKFVQSTPAPAVFKGAEYLPPVQSGVVVEEKVNLYKPAVQTKFVQPVSTPAPAVFKGQEFISVQEVKPSVQFVSTPAPTVFKKQEFVTVEDVKPAIQFVSTPAPTVFKRPEFVSVQEVKPSVQFVSTPAPTVFKKQEFVTVEEVKPAVQYVSSPAPSVFKGQEFVTIEEVKPAVQYVSTPAPVFKESAVVKQGPAVSRPVVEQVQFVSTPAPAVFKGPEYLPPVQEQSLELKSNVRQNVQTFSQSPVIQQVKVSQPTPVRQSFNFVPSTPSSFIFEEKQISSQQDIFRSRPKSKQFFQTVIQPQVSYEEVYKAVTTPATVEFKSPSPTPAEIFSYQSTPVVVSTPRTVDVTPKIIQTIQEEKIAVPVERTTAKPYVYEEYVEEVLLQGKEKEAKTVYYENYERTNPVVTTFQKEVIQPVVQQETYQVSSESPLVVNSVAESVDYYPATGAEIDNYSNFEFQKVGKSSAGQVQYKINSNIEIAPPPEEYVLTASPKLVTSTVAPQTTNAYRVRTRPTTTTAKYEYETQSRRGKAGKATIISVGQVDKDELEDDNVESLLEKYSGDFGNVLGRDKFVTKVVHGEERGEFAVGEGGSSTVGYDVSTSRTRGRYKSTYREEEEEDEESGGSASLDLKNLKLKKNKKTVIIVSQVSDANPLLIGKLAGQCSCQSNQIQVRKKAARLSGQSTTTTTTYLPPIGAEVTSENVLDSLAIEAVTPSTENVILIDGSRNAVKPSRFKGRRRPAGRSRYEEISENDVGHALLSPVPAAEIASTVDYSAVNSVEYGSGAVRSLDETLRNGVECERPGLFRHPKYCNKFYACNYDPWKKKYTLHMFNCPIHLSYDSSISACNWPSKGPACSDDHLLI